MSQRAGSEEEMMNLMRRHEAERLGRFEEEELFRVTGSRSYTAPCGCHVMIPESDQARSALGSPTFMPAEAHAAWAGIDPREVRRIEQWLRGASVPRCRKGTLSARQATHTPVVAAKATAVVRTASR
jgi:hypothetical protein